MVGMLPIATAARSADYLLEAMMIPRKPKWPDRATLVEAVESEMFGVENPGFCLACGEENTGVEPDARGYTCEWCGEPCVYGAEEIVMMMI
jgi:hypothetical protein